MKFSTALRSEARSRIEHLEHADILVGIPSYNNQETIGHVIKTIEEGLTKYYHRLKYVVLVSDGGSVDDTREEVEKIKPNPWSEILVGIYRGIPGKGCALRAIFETAHFLRARACLLYDADLRSITPEWVRNMAEPILSGKYDYVSPYYKRYKYDGTITNLIVYNLTRSLYGLRIRQPIGGDFGLSPQLIEEFLKYDVWGTDVGRFGIDIWMTTNAIVKKFRICEARLGVKIHDVKDPTEALGPMFRQVVDILFELMEEYESNWKQIRGSKPVDMVGEFPDIKPEPFEINLGALVENFKIGYEHFGSFWKSILEPENFNEIKSLVKLKPNEFIVDEEWWAKTLFNFAAVFHKWKKNRFKLVTSITPLYNGSVASFVNKTKKMDDFHAEEVAQKSAEIFENLKDYLIEIWV